MEKHNGQIVEYLVRKNGYSITELAAELDVNRRSIYNYFQNQFLKSDIIYKIGKVIRHDFSKEFPEFFSYDDFTPNIKRGNISVLKAISSVDLIGEDVWKNKYLARLEIYNEALLKRIHQQETAKQESSSVMAN